MKKIIFFILVFWQIPVLSGQNLPNDLQIGKHSVLEWKSIIDTTWGEGLPVEDKLIIFDRFWEAVDDYYPGFVNNPLNWDSVRNHYRPEIEAGVSRGRFTGILNRMGLLLKESHTGAFNCEVYMTPIGPEVPILVSGLLINSDSICMNDNGWFGATLTPIENDRLLVLNTVPNHPLGIEPGDLVIGYDGVAWNDIYPLLLEMEFPITSGICSKGQIQQYHLMSNGSSVESEHHKWMASAGLNWHNFDTLDFLKYGSKDTIHVPTSKMEGKEFFLIANEQIPVKGIEFPGSAKHWMYPNFGYLPPVIFDITHNNTIGYIYYNYMNSDHKERMNYATYNLKKCNLQGLIIDLRMNLGGSMGWETSFNSIFNRSIDSCGFYSRLQGGNHDDLECINSDVFSELSEDFLNVPIALLTGPGAFSNGDFASYFMHTQPMTRSFGKSSSGAYTQFTLGSNTPSSFDNNSLFWDFGYEDWYFQIAPRNFGRIIDGDIKYFIHNGFDVDEEIWFTREAAYSQKDNMVERAAEWIKSVAYCRNISLSSTQIDPNPYSEPLIINTEIKNPNQHNYDLSLKIYEKSGELIEIVDMHNNINSKFPGGRPCNWFGSFKTDMENFYYAEVSTHDLFEDSWLTYPGRMRFTSVKKPELFPKEFYCSNPDINQRLYISCTNLSEIPISRPKLKFSSSYSGLDIKRKEIEYDVPSLEKDETEEELQVVYINDLSEGDSIWINVEILSDNHPYWTDSILIILVNEIETSNLVFERVLNIHPNPLRDFCRIQFSGPETLKRLDVYDITGRVVFSEPNINANYYELGRRDLSKGIYILRVFADKLYERRLLIE